MPTTSILFSINYSQPAFTLHQSDSLKLDRYKCPDWPDLVEEVVQTTSVAVHFNLLAGNGHLSEADWQMVERLSALTDTPYVNLHLGAVRTDFPEISVVHPSRDQSLRIIDNFVADVSVLVEHFGAQRVIVENVPYTGSAGKTIRTSVEPEIISQVIRDANCGFLFDLAHAHISAHYLGIPVWEYILKLPLERLRELHISGAQSVSGVLSDHLALTTDDWTLLNRGLDYIRRGDWPKPWMAAFEYGGLGDEFAWRNQPEVIASQAPMLYDAIKGLVT